LELVTKAFSKLLKLSRFTLIAFFIYKGLSCLNGCLVKRRKKLKENELLFVNIANIHVKDVIQDFVILVILIQEILAQNAVKLIYKIKNKSHKIRLTKFLQHFRYNPLLINDLFKSQGY
jgi:hypothetical protein